MSVGRKSAVSTEVMEMGTGLHDKLPTLYAGPPVNEHLLHYITKYVVGEGGDGLIRLMRRIFLFLTLETTLYDTGCLFWNLD